MIINKYAKSLLDYSLDASLYYLSESQRFPFVAQGTVTETGQLDNHHELRPQLDPSARVAARAMTDRCHQMIVSALHLDGDLDNVCLSELECLQAR